MAAPLRKFAQPLARNLLSDMDLSVEALRHLLGLAEQIKRTPARLFKSLAGRYLSLLFEKPSLRTRLTFELAIKQLGGDAVNTPGPLASASRSRTSPAIWSAGRSASWRGCSPSRPLRNWRSGRTCR